MRVVPLVRTIEPADPLLVVPEIPAIDDIVDVLGAAIVHVTVDVADIALALRVPESVSPVLVAYRVVTGREVTRGHTLAEAGHKGVHER